MRFYLNPPLLLSGGFKSDSFSLPRTWSLLGCSLVMLLSASTSDVLFMDAAKSREIFHNLCFCYLGFQASCGCGAHRAIPVALIPSGDSGLSRSEFLETVAWLNHGRTSSFCPQIGDYAYFCPENFTRRSLGLFYCKKKGYQGCQTIRAVRSPGISARN